MTETQQNIFKASSSRAINYNTHDERPNYSNNYTRSRRPTRGRSSRSRGYYKGNKDKFDGLIALTASAEKDNKFILDSGATNHMVTEKLEKYMTNAKD